MQLAKIILGALLVVAICSAASATLDTKVYTLCERNLSINLTPNFHIMPAPSTDTDASSGSFMQTFTITSTGTKGIAMLMIFNIYDETMRSFDTEGLSQLFTGFMSSYMSYTGDSETDNIIGNWSTVDNMGENVTVDTIDTKGTLLSMYGKKVDMVFWNVDDNNYAYLLSPFDQNVTRQIINTLEIN